MLKFEIFLVKNFKDARFLNPLMDLLYTSTNIRYWSTVLCTTSLTVFYDYQIRVIDLEISC